MEAAIEIFPLPNMGKSQYVTCAKECEVEDLQPFSGCFRCLVQRRSVVALGRSNLVRRECSVRVRMVWLVFWKHLGDVLVDDVGKHGVHGSKIMQRAPRVVKLSLIMFPESNLQHREFNGWIVRENGGHMYRIVVDVWVLEYLRGYLCTREVMLSCNIT